MSDNISLQKIVKEDFAPDQQDLIEKLAYPLNLFMLQVSGLLNKGIDFDNLTFYIKEVEIEADYRGNIEASFKSDTIKRVQGIVCLRAVNTSSPNISVLSTPFISFNESSGYIRLNNATGLVNSGNISNIATSGTITSPAHNLITGQYVRFQGTGLADIDNKTFKIQVLDDDNFNIKQTISSTATRGIFKTDKNKFRLNLLIIPS